MNPVRRFLQSRACLLLVAALGVTAVIVGLGKLTRKADPSLANSTGEAKPLSAELARPAQPTGRVKARPTASSALPSSLPSAATGAPSPAPAATPPPPDFSIENIIRQDIEAGLNVEMREREEQLREAAKGLARGMAAPQVVDLLGVPTHVQRHSTAPGEAAWQWTDATDKTIPGTATRFSYFPTEGQPFNSKHGFGFRVLYIHFLENGTADSWAWDEPPLISGSGNAMRRFLRDLRPNREP